MQGAGYYQCYCVKYGKTTDLAKTDAFCHEYQYDKYQGLALTNTVTGAVSVVNIVLRMLVQFLVDKIGYHTDSERLSIVMVVSFVTAFMNTGIIPLLTNANLEYSPLFFFPLYMQYSDLNRDWYLELGPQMVKTLAIAAFMPIVEICIAISMAKAKQWWDSGLPGCRKKREEGDDPTENLSRVRVTKKKTMFQYISLYAGPTYLIQSKYSQVLLMVFVTFLYGLFLPAMFIIAFVAMFNFYFIETLALAKWYRKPPMLDGVLDLRANHLMRYAPIFFFLLGYWAMGNTQMSTDVHEPASNPPLH